MPGQLFVISAPSGAGKSTIIKALRNRVANLEFSVSHTSRKPRSTEKDGIDYHFVDEQTFRMMIEQGTFVEWARVYQDLYGTSFSNFEELTASGIDVLLDLDCNGAKNIANHFKNSVLIYLLPPSLELLEKRLKERKTDDKNIIKMRMEKAANEIKNCMWFDYIVINDDLNEAIDKTQAIILSERCKTSRQASVVETLFNISVTDKGC